MITLLTLLLFTVAAGAAAEIVWWGPERRAKNQVAQRLRGLRVQAGRRPGALLRQQSLDGASFMSRLEVIRSLQDNINQARLPYRAGNVIALCVAILGSALIASSILQLFPFPALRALFAKIGRAHV